MTHAEEIPMRMSTFGSLIAAALMMAGSSASAAAPKGLAVLQGTWKVVSSEAGGQVTEISEGQPRWVIKEDKVYYGGEQLAVLSVEASTTPKCIDLTFLKPKRDYEGVFSVDGEKLKICVNAQTEGIKQRPLKLATKDEPNWRLLVFERVKGKNPDPTEGLSGFVGIMIRLDGGQVVIAEVFDASPAKKAGLKKNDIILKIDGSDVSDLPATVRTIRQVKPGTKIAFRLKRAGTEKDVSVKAGVLPFMLLD
jgi:uncharacterized protein (TIGR03067 family)